MTKKDFLNQMIEDMKPLYLAIEKSLGEIIHD